MAAAGSWPVTVVKVCRAARSLSASCPTSAASVEDMADQTVSYEVDESEGAIRDSRLTGLIERLRQDLLDSATRDSKG